LNVGSQGMGFGEGDSESQAFLVTVRIQSPSPSILVEAYFSKLTTSSGEEVHAVEGVFGNG